MKAQRRWQRHRNKVVQVPVLDKEAAVKDILPLLEQRRQERPPKVADYLERCLQEQ